MTLSTRERVSIVFLNDIYATLPTGADNVMNCQLTLSPHFLVSWTPESHVRASTAAGLETCQLPPRRRTPLHMAYNAQRWRYPQTRRMLGKR